LKKQTGLVWFYKPETEKTEPNPTQPEKNRVKQKKAKKPSQTGFCPKKPNRTETGRFEPFLVRLRFFL